MTPLLALGFGAGLVAPVNPCGFALLPAYLATFLHDDAADTAAQRLRSALRSGAAVAIGFAGTLTAIAAALAFGLRALVDVIPWLAAAVGIVLVLVGLAWAAGRSSKVRVPGLGSAAGRLARGGRLRLFAFGAGYALASASCTLGILLAVVAQAVAAQTAVAAVAVFAAYAAGSTVLLLALAVAAATANTALTTAIGRVARHLPRIAGALLAASGIYLLAYWTPALLSNGSTTPSDNPLTRLAAQTTAWISTHQTPVLTTALAMIAGGILGAIILRNRSRRREGPAECCATDRTDATDR